jgi:hypothetical protein
MAETVVKAAPSLSLSVPAHGAAHHAIAASSLSAAVKGGASASGTITFTVFGPQPTAPKTCSPGGTFVGTATVAGDGSFHPSAGFTPPAAGNYWWYASYTGDANNTPAASACGASMAKTVVAAKPGGTPPQTVITKAHIDKKKRSATFTFKAAGSTGFQCALVKLPKKKQHAKGKKQPKPRFARCSSPKTYKHLKAGHYTFEVRGVNAAGADPTPATHRFKL